MSTNEKPNIPHLTYRHDKYEENNRQHMTRTNHTAIDMQTVIDAQDNAFVVIDKDYNIVAANNAYCTAYGIKSDVIVGHKCHQVSHHSDKPCHLNGEDCPHKEVFIQESLTTYYISILIRTTTKSMYASKALH